MAGFAGRAPFRDPRGQGGDKRKRDVAHDLGDAAVLQRQPAMPLKISIGQRRAAVSQPAIFADGQERGQVFAEVLNNLAYGHEG
jgi:hypothetical protein